MVEQPYSPSTPDAATPRSKKRRRPEWAAELRKSREMAGMVVEEAAALAGVSARTYRRIEGGYTRGAAEVIAKVMRKPETVVELLRRAQGMGPGMLLATDERDIRAFLQEAHIPFENDHIRCIKWWLATFKVTPCR